MRCLALILLLLAPASGAEEILLEKRVWRGRIEVSSVSKEPPDGEGRETQKEFIDVVLLTEPPRQTLGWPRLPLKTRDAQGGFSVDFDIRAGEGDKRVARKGSATGRLFPRVGGWVEPTTGRYRLTAAVRPAGLVVKTTLSGMWQGRFTTWRTVVHRRPFLLTFDVSGEMKEERRILEGKKTFLDRSETLDRDVSIKWRIERVDPVIAGRVVDRTGNPVGGLEVIARHTNAGRRAKRLPPLVRTARTGADGRYRIDAFFAPWTLELRGGLKDGRVYPTLREGVELRLDRVDPVDFEVDVYRLAALPQPHLLRGYFQGDVERYLAYLKERVPERRLEAALVSPPAER